MALESYHIESFIEYLVTVKGASRNTVEAYKRALDHFNRYTESVEKTGLEHVLQFIVDMKDEGMKVATQAQKLTVLRMFFKFMIEKKVISSDPTSHVDMPKVEQNLPKALTLNEVKSLFNACSGGSCADIRMRAILETLYATGMRISEMCALTLGDLREGQGEFIRVQGKGDKTRLVPLGERGAATLALYLARSRPRYENIYSQWIFPGSKGKAMTRQRMWQLIKELGAKAGVSLSPHHMRHTFATHLLGEEADIRAIQLMMGHANLTTTQIYTKVVTKEMEKALSHHPLNQL